MKNSEGQLSFDRCTVPGVWREEKIFQADAAHGNIKRGENKQGIQGTPGWL